MNSLHNGLILQFDSEDQELLLSKAQIIQFKSGDILNAPDAESRQVYFLLDGTVALFVRKSSNDTENGLAVGLVGSEGALGLESVLGLSPGNLTLLVQSPGSAYAVDVVFLQKLIRRKSNFLMLFSRYLWSLYQVVFTLASMSQTQDIRLRFAHWLILSYERNGLKPLMMTHAHIARMLGVRRASITLVARDMKMAGVIGYSRGSVEIKKLEALRQIAHI